MVVGYVALFVAQPIMGPSNYFKRIQRTAGFAAFYIRELVLANLRVASDVLTPNPRIRPGVLAIPLEANTDAEITLLANLITLTPGSVSLDLSEDKRVLYVHSMYIDGGDVEAYRRSIKEGLERRVLELLR